MLRINDIKKEIINNLYNDISYYFNKLIEIKIVKDHNKNAYVFDLIIYKDYRNKLIETTKILPFIFWHDTERLEYRQDMADTLLNVYTIAANTLDIKQYIFNFIKNYFEK